jgi:hypothetical protein
MQLFTGPKLPLKNIYHILVFFSGFYHLVKDFYKTLSHIDDHE